MGEVARKYPALVRRIAASGFEVASHSFSHRLLDRISRRDCKEDIARSKHILEDLTGAAVAGFRAPSWSARLSDRWLWEHLGPGTAGSKGLIHGLSSSFEDSRHLWVLLGMLAATEGPIGQETRNSKSLNKPEKFAS